MDHQTKFMVAKAYIYYCSKPMIGVYIDQD